MLQNIINTESSDTTPDNTSSTTPDTTPDTPVKPSTNIGYVHSNNPTTTFNTHTMTEIETILNEEIHTNNKSTWNKLDKSNKLSKILFFCDNYECSSSDKPLLKDALTTALEYNKLQKIKDVIYDIENQVIVSIPSLLYVNNKFLVRNDKRTSTSRSLPKNKSHNTKKKKIKIDNKD
jgi:hypothetical protein